MRLVVILLASFFLSCLSTGVSSSGPSEPTTLQVYLGTYTGQGSEGIYLSELDLATGKLTKPKLAAKTPNPSFLALHPSKPLLYAVNEMPAVPGKAGPSATAFSIHPQTGLLTKLHVQSSGGNGPCYISIDQSGRCALIANYVTGNLICFRFKENGAFEDIFSMMQLAGSSVNAKRQEGPHAHCIQVDPANQFVLATDLGTDRLLIYRLDPEQGKMVPASPPVVAFPPGSGPRHLAFHPNGRFVYINHELNSTVSACAYNAGSVKPLQTLSTLPPTFKGNNTTAEIQVHPNGKFLYVSNRGHESIAQYDIVENGTLTAKSFAPTLGKTPRNFCIDPTGTFLLAANQGSNSVVVFRINQTTGELEPTGSKVTVSQPVCVLFRQP
jgi:6-phosphogluconolactonase